MESLIEFEYLSQTFNFITNYKINNIPLSEHIKSSLWIYYDSYRFEQIKEMIDKGSNRLTHITFSHNFNGNICWLKENNYYEKITHITFGDSFNSSVDCLPSNLIYLKFGDIFSQSLDNLPKKLLILIINSSKIKCMLDKLPETLEYLSLKNYNKSLRNLPNSLKIITIDTGSQKNFTVPKSVIALEFLSSCSSSSFDLPENLTHISFGFRFNKYIESYPKTLTHIEFSNNYNQPVDNLPDNLKFISFGNHFNQPIDKLPDSITHLIIPGTYFDKSLDKLPMNLEYLFVFSLKSLGFAPSLSYLKFNMVNEKSANVLDNLPCSLQFIVVKPHMNLKIKLPHGCKIVHEKIKPINYYD
jgi:hypothetical protein